MPFLVRRGYLRAAREASYNTPNAGVTAFPGAGVGPLSTMFSNVATWGPGAGTANVPTIGLPITTKELDPAHAKHYSPAILGRRYTDIMMVPGRRQVAGSINFPATPDALGFWLLMAMGADAVVATTGAAGACVLNAATSANTTTIVITTLANNLSVGQRVFFRDTTTVGAVGAGCEYATVAAPATAGATVTVTITGGAGTGGGLKNAHLISTLVEFGPWTHTFTPSNAASPTQTFQFEDNHGGVPSSPFYTGLAIDTLELVANFENDAEPLTCTAKVIGTSVNSTGSQTNTVNTIASPNVAGGFTLPIEELPVVSGNFSTFTVGTGVSNVDATNLNPVTAGGVAGKLYLPTWKATMSNKAVLAKAQNSSPDPYAVVWTEASLHGAFDTFFEDYSVFYDYARSQIWQNTATVVNWGVNNLVGTSGPMASTMTVNVWNMSMEKTGKAGNKNDLVFFPVDAWRALDNGTNVAKNFTQPWNVVLVNNVASY